MEVDTRPKHEGVDFRELLRRLPREFRDAQEVIPNLWIGGQLAARDLTKLQKRRIAAIVAANGVPEELVAKKLGAKVLSCVLDDDEEDDASRYFEESWRFIEENLREGKAVLVHCTMGVSRSATIVASYLMRSERITLDEALQKLKRARKWIRPNSGFLKQLSELESKLHRLPKL